MIKGDTVKEVLDYVEFDAEMLVRKLRHDVEHAVREGKISYEESGRLLEFYEEGLHGYTYLEEPRGDKRLRLGQLRSDANWNQNETVDANPRSESPTSQFAIGYVGPRFSLLHHRVALRLELIPRLPLRQACPRWRRGSRPEQQLRVLDGAAEIPVRLNLVRRLVVVVGRVLVALLLAVRLRPCR